MLDDLKYIHQKDAQDALGIAEKQGQQLTHIFPFLGETKFQGLYNAVFVGMGGSALAALMIQTWPALKGPFTIVRDYDLPAYVDEHTLVICSSYSGNTEEVLSALAQAEEKGASIAVITGGGKLREIAEAKHYMLGVLPQVGEPRYSVLYNFKALLDALSIVGAFRPPADLDEQLKKAAKFLEASTAQWRADVPTKDNPAKQIAQELIGKSVVVYSGPKLYPAAYKWKIGLNENAKQIAWVNQLPEFNHNEFIGWSKQPVDKPYAVVDLRSNLEHPRTQKRFEVTARLLSGMRPDPIVVTAQGDTILEQMLWTAAFGDFVSIYTGILNGLNPSPVELVEKFKKELG